MCSAAGDAPLPPRHPRLPPPRRGGRSGNELAHPRDQTCAKPSPPEESIAVTDREIRERRTSLERRHEQIVQEWQAYDARYPCEVGAYKPPGYDRQQIAFVDRLSEVGQDLAALPTTKATKLGWAAVIAG